MNGHLVTLSGRVPVGDTGRVLTETCPDHVCPRMSQWGPENFVSKFSNACRAASVLCHVRPGEHP